MKPFKRHEREQLVVELTCYDRLGVRQSLAGVADLRMNIYRQSDMVAVVTDDAANSSIVETGPGNAGDVAYSRPPDGAITRGRYLMVFLCTINGKPIEFPEDDYIPLVIT